jgi:hypothetical protein
MAKKRSLNISMDPEEEGVGLFLLLDVCFLAGFRVG